jgi:hypothetical protein
MIKGTFDKQINISSLAKGIYILHIVSKEGTANEKIIQR